MTCLGVFLHFESMAVVTYRRDILFVKWCRREVEILMCLTETAGSRINCSAKFFGLTISPDHDKMCKRVF